eukprot:GSChrysophyteH1.ASY1.ANO1.2954.1 assembled CDS
MSEGSESEPAPEGVTQTVADMKADATSGAQESNHQPSQSLVETSQLTGEEPSSEVKAEEEEDKFAFKNIKDDESDDSDDGSRSFDDDDPNDILESEGFICPKHLVPKITPMEFEEMVHLFKTYDANDSGDIDKHEARKILHAMDMEATLEKAEELMALVDTDGSGEIEFDEFCEFIVLIKEGDERFRKYDAIMDNVSQTPLGQLEKAAGQQNFKLHFQTVEHREATATNPPVYVVELGMEGLWFERDPDTGITTSNQEIRKFQGLGMTNREAKYNACKAGTVKLRQMMPGVVFQEGDFNDEWYTWIDENLMRGVDPLKITSILAAKGFHPHRNDALMQRIICWQSFDLFLARNGSDFNVVDTTVVDTDFRFWVEKCSRKGIDGEIILKVLEDRAINITEEHPHFAQKLKNNELGYLMDINGRRTKFMSFWTCCEDGSVEDVLIYLESRQPANEEVHSRETGEIEMPLMIAAMNGRVGVCKVLVERGALVNAIDRRGRTALHKAAMNGKVDTCKYLLEAGAMMFEGDFGGNTALHFASFHNHVNLIDYLCFQGQEHTRTVTSDKAKPTSKMTFNQLSAVVFEKIMDKKLTIRDLRRVEKKWLNECAEMFRSLCDEKPKAMLAHTCDQIMDDVLERFDPRPETGVFMIKGTAGEAIFVPSIASPFDLAVLLRYVFRQAAIDSLLLLDRNFPGAPTSTQVREEFMYSRRDLELENLTDMFDGIEKDRQNGRRRAILEECATNAELMSLDLWDIVRTACMQVDKFGQWEKYEDPECLNYFYVFKPKNMMDGARYGPYQWIEEPEEIKVKVHYSNFLKYLISWRCEKLNLFGRWQQYRDRKTHLDVYYDSQRSLIKYAPPKEATWEEALKDSKKQTTVGYSNEWDIVTDNKTGNTFYRDNRSGECFWDKPIDAIVPEVTEKFCTAASKRSGTTFQKYYVCEQCNRAWKTSAEGAKVHLRICEPCIFRCHDGHKGIRYVRELECRCICEDACRIAGCKCNAKEISDSQLKRQKAAYEERTEFSRRREHNALMAPIIAMVPDKWPNGTPKAVSGWQLCRRPPLQGFNEFGAPQETNDESTIMTVESTHTSNTGSFYRGNPVPIEAQLEIAELEEPPCSVEGLPPGWIEIADPEEPEELRRKTRVLVRQIQGFEFIYATILDAVKIGFYRVKYDVKIGGEEGYIEETVQRERITVIMKPTFFCNVSEGLSAWTVDDANGKSGEDKIFKTSPLNLTGPEWVEMYKNSLNRRTFGNEIPELYEEQVDKKTEILYFVNVYHFERDKAVLRIQEAIRRYFRFPWKFLPWTTITYTMYPTVEIKKQMRLRSGWSYLRRRSQNIGEFLSAENDEWEEYVDKDTSEYFYWQEDSNRYLWEKPPLPERNEQPVKFHPIGAEVLFRFPGERDEEIAIVTKLRFDDETGGDCYDIEHKYNKDKKAKWLPRMRVKLKPEGNDEVHMVRFEKQWKNILRRARDKEDRLELRRRQEQEKLELKRLEELRLGIVREDDADLKVSPTILLARHRQSRLEAELKYVKEERERVAGAIRREKTREEIDIIKKEAYARKERISRADILSMTKAIEMRLVMEGRIQERNVLQEELDRRKKENRERIVVTEERLRNMEVIMTTPRSMRRRGLMRKLHVGMRRQQDCYMVCEWGCGDWVRFGHDQLDHQMKRCTKRILPCSLGYEMLLTLSEEELAEEAAKKPDVTVQQWHELEECVKRLVICPRQCLEWVQYEKLEEHMNELCTKRPAEPIYCRLGCGAKFGGLVEKLIEAEDELMEHETDQCEFRMVRCNWKFEDGTMCSGFFKNRRCGNGGGGAYVECLLHVDPYDVLEIVVASGGGGGTTGTEIQALDIDYQPHDNDVIDGECGITLGGMPGGGEGYGGGGYWACGGGGGYTIVSKRSPKGNQALLVAAGGGGGGSVNGLPGGNMDGELFGTRVDPICGGTATATQGGHFGDSGTSFNSKWPASDGEMWKGGNGSEFGAGGGGGYYGGGGGGTQPGIGGGGGGGASYVYLPKVHDYVIIPGENKMPGGLKCDPPLAAGAGEWDKVGGICGQGGEGDPNVTQVGRAGCVRVSKPGFY